MLFHRKKIAPPPCEDTHPSFTIQGRQIPTYLSVWLVRARFEFLLICSDGEGYEEATVEAKLTLCDRVAEFKKLCKEFVRLLEQEPDAMETEKDCEKIFDESLTLFYQFCGRMTFELETDDATAVIAEMEKLMVDEPLLVGEEACQDMIMGFLLEEFGGRYDCSEVQTEVMDYLCKRWGINEERCERLKHLKSKDIMDLLDKIEKRVKGDQGVSGPM